MSKDHYFEYSSIIPCTMEEIKAFHHEPQNLKVLVPKPTIFQMISYTRDSFTSGTVEFKLWFGLIPVHWISKYESGATENSFVDKMEKGPMAVWIHEHIFEETDTGIKLTDKIKYKYKPGFKGFISRMFYGIPLGNVFKYRHWRTTQTIKKMRKSSG